MRGPRLFPFLSVEIGEDQKKARSCRVFTENIGEDYFLRGPRLQPAEPIREPGPAHTNDTMLQHQEKKF